MKHNIGKTRCKCIYGPQLLCALDTVTFIRRVWQRISNWLWISFHLTHFVLLFSMQWARTHTHTVKGRGGGSSIENQRAWDISRVDCTCDCSHLQLFVWTWNSFVRDNVIPSVPKSNAYEFNTIVKLMIDVYSYTLHTLNVCNTFRMNVKEMCTAIFNFKHKNNTKCQELRTHTQS